MGIFDKSIGGSSSGGLNLFSGSSPLAQIGNAVVNQGIAYAKSKIASKHLPLVDAAVHLAQGNYVGAFQSAVNAQQVKSALGFSRFLTASPLTAGLSMEQVQQIAMLAHHIAHARKNLWLINISDYSAASGLSSLGGALSGAVEQFVGAHIGGSFGQNLSKIAGQATKMAINSHPITSQLNEMGGGITSNFNMLATNVSYTPFSIESESYNVGAALVDGVRSAQKAEISITSMDDEQGSIKKWFKTKASQAVHADGTVGILSESLIQIRILHAFVSDNTNMGGFEETLICRPVGVEYEFDRREDGMQEFTMRFEQTDTFL